MALAIPECLNCIDYVNLYKEASELKHHITLDNGAAEGPMADLEEFTRAADRMGVAEIVLPDIIGNKLKTITAVDNFLDRYPFAGRKFQCMAVLHGNTMREAIQAARYYANHVPSVTTLGLPRVLITLLESKSARIDLANVIERTFPKRFQIHLLGASAYWPAEVRFVAKYAGHVRSMDTSMPFNFALANKRLTEPTKVVRPDKYFTTIHPDDRSQLVLENVYILKGWANDGT
jgi:hypothetical protein